MNFQKAIFGLLSLCLTTIIWSQSTRLDSLTTLVEELTEQSRNAKPEQLESIQQSLGESYFQLGNAQLEAKQYQEAKEALLQALAMKKEKPEPNDKGLAAVYEALSNVENRLGKYEQALTYERIAFRINSKYLSESDTVLMNNYYNLSNLYEEQWQLDSAELTAGKGLEIAVKAFGESHSNVARGYMLKGDIYRSKKSYGQAETFYKTALSIYETTENKNNLRSGYNSLAIVSMNQNKFELAIEYYQKSIQLAKKLEGNEGTYTSIGYYNIGLCYKRMGDYEQSIDFINEAKRNWVANLGAEHPYVGRAYSVLSDSYTMLQKNDTAIDYSLKSLEILKLNYGEKHPLTAQQYYITGLIHNNTNDFQGGLEYTQKAIIRVCHSFANENIYTNPSIDDISSKETFLEIITAKIFAFFHFWEEDGDIRKLKAALEAAEMGIATMEAMRREFGTWNDSKSMLNSIYLHIYKSAMRISHELVMETTSDEYLEKAFEIAEKNKAILLLEAMQRVEAKAVVNIPTELTDQEDALLKEIARLEQQIREYKEVNAMPSDLTTTQTQLLKANQGYADLIEQISREYPRFHQLKYDNSVALTSDIQALLDDETVFVEYILKTNEAAGEIDEAAIYIMTISKEGTAIEKASFPADLKDKITRFYRLFSSPSIARTDRKQRFVTLSAELYQNLIQPIESQIEGKSKLIIVGESVLNYIPFGALLPKVSDQPYDKLPFLIKDFDISYHYSGTLLKQLTASKARAFQGDLLAFAPVFEDQTIASVNTRHLAESVDTTFRAFTEDGKFDPLPSTEKEIQSIQDLFVTNQKTRNFVLLHGAAEEPALKQKLEEGYRFVHLASHSFANLDNPKFSGIACAQIADAEEDGILYTNEIYQLNLNTDLVVLSSCESGFGKLIEGEGMLGLNRGFVYAGVPNVVFSLYKIQDNITEEFMTNFYDHILSNQQPYSTALRQAKLALLKDKVTASPYYWAGFLLVGQ